MNHSNINLNGLASSDDYLDHDDGNHFFGNKCMPMKALDNTDYMIVSSEEIIDILDLTNDEVEQILDDNMISSQDFDTLNSPRLSQSQSQSVTQPQLQQPQQQQQHHQQNQQQQLQQHQLYNRIPRINLATNLTKVTSPPPDECEGKGIDMRPLETPTINLESTVATETDVETIDTIKVITMPASVNKKKSGRTKGARQISMYFVVFICCSYTALF